MPYMLLWSKLTYSRVFCTFAVDGRGAVVELAFFQ